MKRVFHGELPGAEKSRVLGHFSSLGVSSLPRDEFLAHVQYLQHEKEGKEMDLSTTAHYTSFAMLRDHKLREVRPEHGPSEVFTKPLTMLTEVGWRATETPVGFVRYPKKQCEETKFMGELFKAGVI
jgi:hypothetical protein